MTELQLPWQSTADAKRLRLSVGLSVCVAAGLLARRFIHLSSCKHVYVLPLPSPLHDVIALSEVQSLSGLKTFARVKAYFHDGAVSRLEERHSVVRANVRGTHRYSVELGVGGDGELTYECNCPVGGDGVFCEHAVAVALSWLENTGEEVFHAQGPGTAKPRKKRKTNEERSHPARPAAGSGRARHDAARRATVRGASPPQQTSIPGVALLPESYQAPHFIATLSVSTATDNEYRSQ
ncbi:hypothetical protein OKW41_006214 [Paraburkholderia sp. UCT70]|uniref:SWIM zinc finger family protein n=1 Tax=Paraburkholderia sp. UCT70 TaxID=2991068 RepID=UPI003D20EA04